MNYCLITDRKLYRHPLHEVASAAESAGVDYFQLREKDLEARDLLALAKSIRPSLKKTKLIVNGCLEVALAAKADGVHLQKENIPIETVRKRFPNLMIGYSAHSSEEINDAQKRGASYVFISPVFSPVSKDSAVPPLGAEVAAAWIQREQIPVYALGGITPENLALLNAAGIDAVAGISFFIRDGKFTDEGMIF